MKNINKIGDKHKIDLISLNNFLLDKGDNELECLFMIKGFKKIDYSLEKVQEHYLPDLNVYNQQTVPKELWEYYSFCIKAVKDDGRLFNFVPSNLIDYQMCEIAVTDEGSILGDVPNKFKDYALCEKAVYDYGLSLMYVPDTLKDYAICKTAISNDPTAIPYVPKTIENYYSLLKIVFENETHNEKRKLVPINYFPSFYNLENYLRSSWFPKEYIPQLIKDFPKNKERFENFLLKEYISKEVKKLLSEHYLKKKIIFNEKSTGSK